MTNSSKKLISEFLKHKALLGTALLMMFFSGITSVLPSWFVKVSIDGLAALQNKVEKFNLLPQQVQNWLNTNEISLDFFNVDASNLKNILPLAIVGVFLLEAIFKFSYQYSARLLGLKVVKDIRERFHSHINQMPMSEIRKIDSGSLVSVVSSDLQSLQSWLAESLMNLFSESFKAVFLFTWLLIINWKLTLISTFVIPLFAIPVIKLGKGIRNNAKAGQDQVGSVSSYISESIYNQNIVKAFNLESLRGKGFQEVSTQLFKTFKKWALYMAMVSPLTNLVGAIGISAILYYGLNSVINQTLTVGEFSSFFVTSLLLYDPVKRLGRVSTIFQSALGVADRFYKIFDIEKQTDLMESRVLENPEGAINIKALSFSYPGQEKLFTDFNLGIAAKSSIALVGPSGSGKSSIVNLLLRFYDFESGVIEIDGLDIKSMSLKELREQFALVSQEPLLFSATIKENILYGLESSNQDLEKFELEKRFQTVCKKAKLTEFLEELPEKEHSQIAESATNLSQGQKQRISIARAFMSYAPIVILDEPTSALDNESQEAIYQSIQELMKEKTVIVIAHRLSTIKACDKIVYLEQGQIREQGSHDELVQAGSAYAGLLK